ncbi:hypothetical protein [Ruminococcus albus]|nr:hypothetical protein [Ruminococcus albus]MCC3351432.1 hypothetical protein [Ruminococcus albus 8]
MFRKIEIDSILELPYKLIDIGDRDEQFVLAFKCFEENQTDYSIQAGGVTGKFEVTYKCCGIDSQFEIDMTIGNLYYFYVELDNAYECLPGSDPVAILKNYGTLDRTDMTFRFDKLGHIIVSGSFKNKNNNYKCAVAFDMQIDTSYIYDILHSLKYFFDELKRIQGHSNFY